MLCSRREHIEKRWTELPRKSPTALPPALAIPSHSRFAVTSYFPGEAGCDSFYPTVCPTTSPKQVVYKKSLGTDLCYRVTTKALYRGYTNYAPHGAHSHLSGISQQTLPHSFSQRNHLPWKQVQSSARHYDHNQIHKMHSCK